MEGALDRRPPLHCCVVLCPSLKNAPNNDMGSCSSRIIWNYCPFHEFQRPTSRKCHVRRCEYMSVFYLTVTIRPSLIDPPARSPILVRTSGILLLGRPASPAIRSAPTICPEPPKLPTTPQRPHRRACVFSPRRVRRADGGDDPPGGTILGRRGGRRGSRERYPLSHRWCGK